MGRIFQGVSAIKIYEIYIIDNMLYKYEYCPMDITTPYHYYPIKGSYVRMRFSKIEIGKRIARVFSPRINRIVIPDGYYEING